MARIAGQGKLSGSLVLLFELSRNYLTPPTALRGLSCGWWIRAWRELPDKVAFGLPCPVVRAEQKLLDAPNHRA
eukprot:16443561-Heterocapsa_arctica.AAC.1